MTAVLKQEHEAGYNRCQELLVCSWRRVVTHGVECPLVERDFRCACGATGDEVFASFCTFLWALAIAQRRCLTVNRPGARSLTTDELRMLALLAATQNRCRQLLDAHLTWIARRAQRATLERGTRDLATALSQHGLLLPL